MHITLSHGVAQLVRDIVKIRGRTKRVAGISIGTFIETFSFLVTLFTYSNVDNGVAISDTADPTVELRLTAKVVNDIKKRFLAARGAFLRPAEIALALMEMHAVGHREYFMTFMGSYLSTGETMRGLHAATASMTCPKPPQQCAAPPNPPPGIFRWGPQYAAFRKDHEAEFIAYETYVREKIAHKRELQEYRKRRFPRAFERDIWWVTLSAVIRELN
jgi:hypothetical protein